MKLKEARQSAIAKAKSLKLSVYIYRTAPRQFEITTGAMPEHLAQIIHASWAKDGWYEKYHPEYFQSTPQKETTHDR